MKITFRPQKLLFFSYLVQIKQFHSCEWTGIDDASSKCKTNSQSCTENNAHLPDAREQLSVQPVLKVYT